jgi:hypothetical protein
MLLTRIFLRTLPYLIVAIASIVAFSWLSGSFSSDKEPQTEINHHTMLKSIEAIGKVELVKYNFKEITELAEKNEKYLWIFDVPDSRAVLISHGEATGCIDLTKIKLEDIQFNNDAVTIKLPLPELCYYKLDLNSTKIYSLQKARYFSDEKELIEKAYKSAEEQIKNAALNSGILDQTKNNAEVLLKPILEKIAGKKVYFTYDLDVIKDNPW